MTEPESAFRMVETIEELVQDIGIELIAVYPYKLMAERADDFDGALPVEYDIEHDEETFVAVGGDRLAVRIISKFVVRDVCFAEVDFAAEWQPTEPVQLSQEAVDGFVSRIGVMTLWPYIRQAAQDMILRTANAAITLPMRMPVTKPPAEGDANAE